MILKDFKEMVNRVLFCAKSGFLYGSGGGEIILKKEDGNLVIAAGNHLLYSRFGLVRLLVEDDGFEDFFKTTLEDANDLMRINDMQDSQPLSIYRYREPFPEIPPSLKGARLLYVPFQELRFNVGSTCIATRCFDHCSWDNYINDYSIEDGFFGIGPHSFSANRQTFIDTLGMVSSIVPCQFSSLLHIDLFPGKLVLRTSDFEDTAQVELPCDYSGEETAFTFELKLFRETLEHIDTDSVSIRFGLRNIDVAIMPVHPTKKAKVRLDYFFILAQKIRWGN